jgi:hypothetical protein
MPKQNTSKNKKPALPEKVQDLMYADFGSDQNLAMANELDLEIGQITNLTRTIGDVIRKQVSLDSLKPELTKRLKISDKEAAQLEIQILAKRLLILDDIWFKGEISSRMTALGDDPAKYKDYLVEYKKAAEKEIADEELELLREETSEGAEEYIEKQLEEVPLAISDPAAELKGFKDVFTQYIYHLLTVEKYDLKIEMNIRLMTLLLGDEDEKYLNDLIRILYQNKENLTKNKIIIGKEKLDPTIANWLKDYIRFIGEDEVVSTVKKAQYFSNSKNIKSLTEEERVWVDKLLDLYVNLKNFYFNVRKLDLSEVEIFPYSEAEEQAFLTRIDEEMKKRGITEIGEGVDIPGEEGEQDIAALFAGNPQENAATDSLKQEIVTKTRKEYDKVADEFENYILSRKRHGIIACLEILVETGALDNLLAKDVRFSNLLFGYFKRNNQQGEEVNFKKDPYQAKYIQAFLKFLLLERLGLPNNEAARLATKMSNLFRSKGATAYAELAYLDIEDKKFKWTDL